MKQSKAVVQQRQYQIRRLFVERNSLQIAEVSKILGVSELTVRRDFSVLEQEGFIRRFHGGGQLLSGDLPNAPLYEDKDLLKQRQKQQIARYISRLIQEKDTVFLNAGTTTLEVIKAINHKNVMIVTNNAPACTVVDGTGASLISTGGEFNPKTRSFTGIMAVQLIQKMCAQVCVLGVNGISGTEGITTSNYMETMINDEFLNHCKGKRIVAADGSKIGKTFNFISAPIQSVDLLVTDSSADTDALEKIRERGIEIVLADQLQD